MRIVFLLVMACQILSLADVNSQQISLSFREVKSTSRRLYSKVHGSFHHLHYDLMMARNRDRTLFVATLYFSKHKIPVDVVLDTGSSVLWIFKKSCLDNRSRQVCGHKLEDSSYEYLDGAIQGEIVSTDVFLNDAISNANCFVFLTEIYDKMMDEPILGLGPRTSQYPTFLETMKTNGLIPSLVFSLDIRNRKVKFGPPDDFISLNWIPIESWFAYQVKISKVYFFGTLIYGSVIDGIIDSGNTLIALPMSFRPKLMEILETRGYSCSIEVEENISFSSSACHLSIETLDGALEFEIAGKSYSIKDDNLISSCEKGLGKRKCATVIEFHNVSEGIILGQPFMNNYEAIFDLEASRVAFKPSALSTNELL